MATMTQTTVNSQNPGEIPARLAARLIDTVVLVLIGVALGRQIGFRYDWLIATASLVLIYFVLSDVLLGATLGKAAVRLQVTDIEGKKPTMKQAFKRECFTLLGAIPFAGPFLAAGAWVWIVVTIRSSPLRRGIHDQWAGTCVVRRWTETDREITNEPQSSRQRAKKQTGTLHPRVTGEARSKKL